MAELCGEAFKAAWFIKATLRNGWIKFNQLVRETTSAGL
jgi:hypothetical protein